MSIVKMPFADCVGCHTRWKTTEFTPRSWARMHCPLCGGDDFTIGFQGEFRHGQQIPLARGVYRPDGEE